MNPNFAIAHPDAHRLYVGEAPQSYRAVAHTIATLLKEYNNAEGETAKTIKDQVLRTCAHCNSFARGEVEADIAIEEWFDVIKSAASEVMNLQPSQVHAIAMKNGENRDLEIKTRPANGPLQDKYLPYLQSSFSKTLNTIIARDQYSFLDPDELKAVIMMVHADYLDLVLRRDSALNAVPGSTVTAPPNKDLGRALVKVFSDYNDKKNPSANLLDVVRRSIVTDTLLAQENVINFITTIRRGSAKSFQVSRYKSTMNSPDEPIKFILINVVYTPTTNNAAGKTTPLTFAQMVTDPVFSTLVTERQQRDDIDKLYIEAAREVLLHPRFEKQSIAMVIELQLYLAHFLERKKRMHAIYKCLRPTSAADLTRDLAKYATHKAMAYVAEQGQMNASAKAKLYRYIRQLRPDEVLGSIANPNKKLNFRYYKKQNNSRGETLADAIVAIAEYCKAFGIETLDLYAGGAGIGAEGAAKLAEALKQNTSLTTLDLGLNDIGAEGAAKLAEALTQNTSLMTLKLYKNQIGAEGAAKLAEALKKNTSLTMLKLYANGIGAEGAAKLAEALKQNTSLTTLDLTENGIRAEGAAKLAEALKQNTSMTTLNLDFNFIDAKGAAKLAEALKQNTSLTTLKLYRNQIGAEGAAKLAEALKQNTSLTTLNLYGNHIQAEGASKLAEALKQNTSLTTLNLRENGIGVEGAAKLVEALKQNTSLTTLDLSNNHIQAEGMAKLADALKQTTSLTTLDIGKNYFDDNVAAKLAEALTQNTSLTKLRLSGNGNGAAGKAKLTKAWKTGGRAPRDLTWDGSSSSRKNSSYPVFIPK